jgi:hypothetical protein
MLTALRVASMVALGGGAGWLFGYISRCTGGG